MLTSECRLNPGRAGQPIAIDRLLLRQLYRRELSIIDAAGPDGVDEAGNRVAGATCWPSSTYLDALLPRPPHGTASLSHTFRSGKRPASVARPHRIRAESHTPLQTKNAAYLSARSVRRNPLPFYGFSGEGGIRTPGPSFPGHGISSAAQSATLSPLRAGVRRCPLFREHNRKYRLHLSLAPSIAYVGPREGRLWRRWRARSARSSSTVNGMTKMMTAFFSVTRPG